MNIKDIVKGENLAYFSRYAHGEGGAVLYYDVSVDSDNGNEMDVYEFPIPAGDIEYTSIKRDVKATTLMRWIRKAIDDGTFVKVRVEPMY